MDKRHISEDRFKAYECNEETDLSTAEFSLNEPPACNRDDGRAKEGTNPAETAENTCGSDYLSSGLTNTSP